MRCALCKREGDDKYFEYHHFEPVATRRKTEDGIDVCNQCGDQLHLLFTNMELRDIYNDLPSLLLNEKVKTYIRWVRDKPLETHYVAAKKKRKK